MALKATPSFLYTFPKKHWKRRNAEDCGYEWQGEEGGDGGENPGVGRIPGKYGCFLEREVEAHVGVFSSKTTCQLVFSIVGSACVCLRVCVWSTRRFCTHQMLFLYFKTFYLLNIESQTGKSHQTTLTDVAVVLCTPAIKTQTEFLQLKNIS